ncbi:MAG: hypothetical protein M3P24_09895 [Gemmatimonadota bacterium]|nr:hypothetical protein [Gemmatimonadota bacterium]
MTLVRLFRSVLAALPLALIVGRLEAQSCTSPKTTDDFSVTSPSTLSFSPVAAGDFNTGSIDRTISISFTPRNNTAYAICVRFTTTSTSLGNGKPLSDLLYQPVGGTYTALSTTYQQVAAGSGRTAVQNMSVPFRMLLSWVRDSPFTYGGTVEFYGTH